MSTTETVEEVHPVRRGRPKAMKNLTVDEIVLSGQQVLAAIVEAEKAPEAEYRKLSNLLIQLRMRFQSPHRDCADWAGRTREYREAAQRIYASVNIPPDSAGSIQARIRYHNGERLREVAPPAELEAVGIKAIGPAGQARERRALERAKGPLKTKVESRADVYRACRQAIEALVPDLPMPETDSGDYSVEMGELTELTSLCTQLWAVQEKRRADLRNRMQLLTTYQQTREFKPQSFEEMAEIRRRAAEEARIMSGMKHPGAIEAATAVA